MKRNQIAGIFIMVFGFLFLLASTGECRIIKGTTVSNGRKLVASAVAKNGAAVTVPVRVIRAVTLPSGKRQFTGTFSMNVRTGKKVMMVFSTVGLNGVTKGKAVAKFTKVGQLKTTQFKVTPPVAVAAAAGLMPMAASPDINLGRIVIAGTTATPLINPLTQVDSDADGTPDSSDTDDDNDGIPDSRDSDSDGNGVPDSREDLDTDDDGSPDVVDSDDDDDGIPDSRDADDDDDGIADWEGDTDSDDDSIPDSTDSDDDNDGVVDSSDSDMDGDGLDDSTEQDSDGDGIPDDCDSDDDNDGTSDSVDTDDDGDGTLDDDEADTDGDGIPDDSDEDDDGDGIPDPEDPNS